MISSCGHAGIINTLRRAQDVTGIDKIYALVGGFHLAPASDDYLGPKLIKPTIQERRRGKQMRDNFEPICRSGLRCA